MLRVSASQKTQNVGRIPRPNNQFQYMIDTCLQDKYRRSSAANERKLQYRLIKQALAVAWGTYYLDT